MTKFNICDIGESILAPMAGITGFPFRKIALKYGADFCFTEMISSIGFLRGERATLELAQSGEDVEKTGIQLFGNSPDILSQAAKKAADIGFRVIDLNMGCPVKKVIKTGSGSALLRDIDKLSLILKAIRHTIKDSIFTIKIRSGFNEGSINFMEVGKIAESMGVDAIFFHPRTRLLMFKGQADHSLTKRLKHAISVPIYASGDILDARDATRITDYTDADGVIFARGAIGSPWIFKEYKNLLRKDGIININIKLKTDIIAELMYEMGIFYGKERGARLIRPHLYNFLKGFRGSKELRCRVNNAQNEKELIGILKLVTEEEYYV